MAYYFIENDYRIDKQYKAINRLYEIDYPFISLKYKKDKKRFKIDVQEMIEYLTDNEEYNKEEQTVQKDYEQLGINYKNLSEEDLIDYYFMTVRLDCILENKKYSRKKLRTLLKTYGYKRKSNKIINHIKDSLLFYHITGYVNKEEINISEVNLDQMITFFIQDFKDIDFNEELINTKIQLIYELFENEIINFNDEIKINHDKESVQYFLKNKLLFEVFFKEEYLKVRLNVKEKDLVNSDEYTINYYLENTKICLYLHDRKDIKESIEFIKQSLRSSNQKDLSNINRKNISNESKNLRKDIEFEKGNFVSDIYKEIERLLRD